MIRPLKKIEAGHYVSSDYKWHLFKEKDGSWNTRNACKNPYFFWPYPTLKSLITAIEKLT